MKLPLLPCRLAGKCLPALLLLVMVNLSIQGFGQKPADWKLEKMPVDLETDFVLSALPPYARDHATVYLLDPEKGYYVSRPGTNGFMCFLVRTEWESGEFRQDLASAISYDVIGAKTIFPAYVDVEAMRASGKLTAAAIKDTMTNRYARGYYKTPERTGISYMLAPVMRTYIGEGSSRHVASFSMPHYMFYAPYMTDADIGGNSNSGGPFVLGDGKGPHGYIIMPAGVMEKAKMMEENSALLKRLIAYKAYFDPGPMKMNH